MNFSLNLYSLIFTKKKFSEDIEKYDRLKKNYEDPTFEVVSGVFRALAKKKIIGAGNFQRYTTPSLSFIRIK